MKVTISRHNSALASIPSVNLPAIITCRPDAPCAKLCYACKGNFRFGNVQRSMRENLYIYRNDPDLYEQSIYVVASMSRYFRWHSSGDIVDMDYLKMMVRIAKRLPATKFLAFTKKFEMINEWLDNNSSFPSNLVIVFSAWDKSFEVPNPYNLPVAYVLLRHDDMPAIPQHAKECMKASKGTCAQCVVKTGGCWAMKSGDAVYFKQH